MQAGRKSVDVGRLKILAEKVNTKHRHFQNAERRAVNYAAEAGALLLEVKEAVGHGNFTKWVEENFEGSQRHATRYMKLAKAVAEERIDLDSVSSLAAAESLLRDQDAEPAPEVCESEEEDGEFEPELPNEEYLFKDEEDFKKWAGECEPEDGDEEHETKPPSQGAAQKPARKRDLRTSALSAVNRFIHEVPGEEKDRIQAIRERLDMEESGLLPLASEEGRRS